MYDVYIYKYRYSHIYIYMYVCIIMEVCDDTIDKIYPRPNTSHMYDTHTHTYIYIYIGRIRNYSSMGFGELG